MERRTAALGSAAFFVAAPGTVAGLLPWLITRWRVPPSSSGWAVLRVLVGSAVVVACLTVLVRAFVRFVREGRGTPAPIAETERLVIGGDYRYVRNPMYVAVVGCVAGQAVVLASPALAAYGAAVWAAMASFVRWYEEPRLLARFGAQYEDYRRTVPAWVPRRPAATPLTGSGGRSAPIRPATRRPIRATRRRRRRLDRPYWCWAPPSPFRGIAARLR